MRYETVLHIVKTLCIRNYYINVDAVIKAKAVWEEAIAKQILAPFGVQNRRWLQHILKIISCF